MEKIPFITSPDVKNVPESEKPDMLDAQKTEQLVYEYKVKQEEMLSIFDEIREYLDYEDILTANTHIQEEGEDGLSNEIQEKISKYLGSLDPNNENHRILFHDFKKLWQENPDLISRALAESIKNRETKKISDTHLGKGGQVDQEKINQEVEARTIGKVMKAVYLLNFHFNPLEKELSEMSEDDLERISAYEKANFNKVRNVISEIQEMKEGINSAKSSKNVDVVRKTDEVARIHGTSPDEVKNVNTNLEKSLSKIFGKKFSFGIETKFDEMGNIVERDFLTAYVNYHREMKELHQLLNQGRLVETKYVKEIIERALPALKKNPPTVVFFHGDQGTGKTALAVHISRTRFGKEPIIVAGNKYLDPERFTEEFRIQKLDPVDFINQIRKQLNLSEVSKDADPAEVLAEVVGTKDQFRQTVLDNQLREEYKYECAEKGEKYSDAGFEKYKSQPRNNSKKIKDTEREVNELFSNGIQGRYMMGAIYLAMKEGRPLIIDEANAISPEVLIAFNDLMTKKLGEKMTTRTDDKEFKIKDGYCVMWTGNTGERFKQARFQNMDPAAFSRIVPIKYGYLPQSREVNNMDTVLKRLDLDKLSDKAFDNNTEAFNAMKESKQQASTDQIFQVMLVKLLNKRLGTGLLVKTNDRYSVFKDIYKLSVGARIIMDMFEGKAENLPSMPNLGNLIGSTDSTVLMKELKSANLTLRELMDNIIGGYLDEGCSMDIEFYLFKFVKKYDMAPKEQAIIYAILQKAGFFAPANKWPNYQNCQNIGEFEKKMDFNPITEVDKYKNIQKNGESVSLLNTQGEYKLEYFSSLETVQLLFGYLPPRTKKDYATISKKRKELGGTKKEEMEKRAYLLDIQEIIDSLELDMFPTSKEAKDLMAQITALKISDTTFIETAGDKSFFEEVHKFYDILINFMHSIKKINDADFARSKDMTLEEKSNFVKEALGKKTN